MNLRLLLDTHIAIWAVAGSARLGAEAEAAILAADEVFVSVASLWEIAIKRALGKAGMPVTSQQALQAFNDAGYVLLDIRPEHAVHVERLPPIHKDPFDRLLVAQAMLEPLTLITSDKIIPRYSVAVMRVG